MDTTDQILQEHAKKSSKAQKNLIAFVVSFLLAVTLWFFQSLDKTYIADIRVDARYYGQPEGLILLHSSPQYFVLKVEASGWDIFQLRNRRGKRLIDIDLSSYFAANTNIISSVKNTLFTEDLPGIRVLSVLPDTLNLTYDKLVTKRVAVKPDYKLGFEKNYGLARSVRVKPGFVEISGPESVVRNIVHVYTDKVRMTGLSDRLSLFVDLEMPVKHNIVSNPSQVEMLIDVEALTEGQMIIPIHLSEKLKDSIYLIPEKIKVSYRAALSVFESIGADDFKAYIDIEEFNKIESGKLKVKLTVRNEYIYRTHYEPEFVDFIIIR